MNWQTITPEKANHLMNQNEKDWLTDKVEFHRQTSFWHKFCSMLSYVWYPKPQNENTQYWYWRCISVRVFLWT